MNINNNIIILFLKDITNKLFSITFFCLLLNCVFGQTEMGENEQIDFNLDMFPKTPEAASLSKFVDIPAGSYTGVADFSIPLYNIEVGGANIPIEIKYTTTGVKVSEIATRVGLGWAFIAGPSLSQQVIGAQDVSKVKPILPQGQFNPIAPGNPSDYNDPYFIAMRATGILDGEDITDIKHDVYSYSLLNTSGQFIFDSSGSYGIPMPYNQIKITPHDASNTINIIDEEGIKYQFHNDPMHNVFSKNSCVGDNYQFLYNDPNYRIKKITLTNGEEVIYTYGKSTNSKYITSVSEQKRLHRIGDDPSLPPPHPLPPRCFNYSESRERVLTEISFNGGKVRFFYNNDLGSNVQRLDLPGDVYLTRVLVVSDKNDTIKDFSLTYDYFESTDPIPSYANYYSSYLTGANKRLRLLKVTDNLIQGDYHLTYYNDYKGKTLPNRISNDQDYWGVFNGANNGTEGIPTVKATMLDLSETRVFLGANKEPDINYGRIGNLKRIQYPTGGYTEVVYEADDYVKSIYVPPVYNYTEEYESSFQYDPGIITILPEYYNKYIHFFGNDIGTSPPPNSLEYCKWRLLNDQNQVLAGGNTSGTFKRMDLPGTYKLEIIPGENPSNACYAEYWWIKESIVDDSKVRKAGTIRVQKIESFDNNNGKIIREYTYKDPSTNMSSGKNLGNEIFIALSTKISPSGINGFTAKELVASNNPGWQIATVRGKPVGYDYVQEHYISENDSLISFRKEYKFKNDLHDDWTQYDPYNPISYTWPVLGLDRGLILEEKIFDSTGKLVKEITKEYQYDTHFNSLATSHPSGSSLVGEGLEVILTSKTGIINEFIFQKFPIRNYWITDTLTTTREYKDAITFIEYFKKTKYSIPQYKHTYPVEVKSVGSLGENIRKEFYYPQDLNAYYEQDNMMTKLIERNQINTPIIIKTFENNIITSEQRKHYNHFHANSNDPLAGFILPQFIFIKKGDIGATSSTEDRKITYDWYDDKGNLTEYTLDSGIPISIIWGYNKKYPIAKIEGMRNSEIPASLITNIVNASNSDHDDASEDNLRAKLEDLRRHTTLKDAIVTGYTYDPLIGVTSVISPNGQEMFYKYDAAGRLERILDKDGKLVKKMEYNYQH